MPPRAIYTHCWQRVEDNTTKKKEKTSPRGFMRNIIVRCGVCVMQQLHICGSSCVPYFDNGCVANRVLCVLYIVGQRRRRRYTHTHTDKKREGGGEESGARQGIYSG